MIDCTFARCVFSHRGRNPILHSARSSGFGRVGGGTCLAFPQARKPGANGIPPPSLVGAAMASSGPKPRPNRGF
ncbi:hypothetical protein MPTK1_5g20360 [Marchantia polymorpha subsp. ruderalis]|uniref:Uncharacterized protein n=2 Tax=Marchantia polymorpha TaxID=3197 RepID=A0AAF6BKD5_MARPO|nr:hypothetical protein MARPO_0058s0014 [Marchantia polymorpha]BBN12469.1 hypothetical protein Mp_5g20360 [Marchantia polymorpha subsp. ruderalis]|eukprot:PTQ37222.1 hypothetical protein MARPO_0058s0014 [Marchantia polymorpha]